MKMYSTKEVAKILDVNEETIRRWVREGLLKAVRNCGRGGHKFTESELERFKGIRRDRKHCYHDMYQIGDPMDIERFKQEVYEILAEFATIEAKLTSILNELERG